MKLTLLLRPTSYGKYVCIESTKTDKTVHNLKGKVISKITAHSQANLEHITQEIEANRRLHHQNVLRMQMYLEDEVFHYLIFPDFEKTDLRDLLIANKRLSEEAARPIFRELVLGIQHIHSNSVIHGQLSPSSVVFYKDHVRVSDLSLCTLAGRGEKKSIKSGPIFYMAPESFRDEPFDGTINDIWSCGIILFEMLAGHLPFTDTSKKATTTEIKRGNIVYPKTFSSTVIFLLKDILNPTPHDRATVEQILSHPWMMKTREVPIARLLRPDASPSKRKTKTVAASP
jgi:5'-AMP-activated protein kinase catalytic alpha subunit